jgi:hypothetical protein
VTGGAAGAEDTALDGALDDAVDGPGLARIGLGVVLDAVGSSATAPGAGPDAEGRLLTTNRTTTTATTAVTATSGGMARFTSRDAGLAAR